MKTRSMLGALAALSLVGLLVAVALTIVLPAGDAYAGTVTVQLGQTLSQVAVEEHTTVAALVAANNIANPNLVVAGTVLQVPGSTPPPTPPTPTPTPTPAPVVTVTVQLGQTLSQVAVEEHTTVAALVAANKIGNPNLVVAGTVLHVPGPGASAAVSAAPAFTTIEVKPGDTLTSLAAHYGITPAVLASVNHIANPNLVLAGTVLELPASSTSPAVPAGTTQIVGGGTVTVHPGDTLTSLAAHYGTTTAALASVNHITNPNVVVAGMQLTLPSSVLVATSTAAAGAGGGGYPTPLLSHPDRLALQPDFAHSASVSGVPLSLLEALCWWESGWQNNVISSSGALGVCQIEPTTAAFVNSSILQTSDLDPRVAADNIALSAAYLRYLLNRTGGNASAALAGYYQGLVSVQQQGLLPSTHAYVAGILAYASIFAGHG